MYRNQLFSHDPRERSGVLKAIAGRDDKKALFHLKRIKYKRNLALCVTPLMLINAIRYFERWTSIQPAEWNGFRFFAFILSSLAFVAISIYLVQQIKRVNMLKAIIRSRAV